MKKLIIAGETIDIWGGDDIPVDYAVADIREIGEGLSDASKTFQIVGSRDNLRKLGMPDLLSGSDITAINQQTRIPARYEVGGLPVIVGYYKITGVTIDKGHTLINGMIVSGNGTWVQQIEDEPLSDLDFSDDIHTLTAANIIMSWSGYAARSYIYPFIDYGGSYPLTLPVTYFRPAVKVRSIIDQMFAAIGWTYESEFLDSEFFGRLYSLCGHQENLPESFATDRSISVARTTDYDFSVNTNGTNVQFTIPFDSIVTAPVVGTYDITTGIYSVPDAMVARSKISVTVDVKVWNLGQNLNITLFLYGGVPGAFVDLERKIVKTTWSMGSLYPSFTVEWETGEHEFVAGGVAFVRFYVYSDVYGSATNEFTISAASWQFIVERKLTKGSSIDPKYFLPKVSQLELLQTIKHKFNLVFFPDINRRKIYVEPYDDFFLPASSAVDWTDKVDRSQPVDIEYNDIDSKELLMGYAEDSNDWNLKMYDDTHDIPYGSALHTYGNAFAKGREEKRCGVFAPTYMGAVSRQMAGVSNRKLWPIIWQEPDESETVPEVSYEYEPRLIYLSGIESNDRVYSIDGVQVLTIPRFHFVSLDAANDASLSFETLTNSNGLKDKYFRRALHQQEMGRVVKMRIHLTQMDVQSFDPRKPIKIDQAYYLVVELSEWVDNAPTEVVMLERRTTGAVQGKTITGNTIPPPVGKQKPVGASVGEPIYMMDYRMRPPTLLPVLVEAEDGTLQQLYTGG